jgi:hypothetical protein
MAETAGFVLIDGEALIEEEQLAEGVDLSLAIERGAVHLAESVGLNAIEVGNDFGHVLIEGGGHLTGEVAGGFCLAGSGCTSLRFTDRWDKERGEGEKSE